VVARHRLDPDATGPVWDPAHKKAAEAIALGRAHPGLRLLPPSTPAPAAEPEPAPPCLLDLDGDYDIDAVDLDARYGGCGCTGTGLS
jgi:hypothetical protein